MPEPALPPEPAEPVTTTEGSLPGASVAGTLARFGLPAHRLERWTKILATYFSAQGLVQLLGVAAGLLYIRFMPVEQYALYTLAFSVIGFFGFVTDLGSTGSLVYFRHATTRDGEAFEPYVAAVEALRRLAFVVGGVTVLAVLPLVARGEGFGLGESALAALAVVASVWFQISAAIRLLKLRLDDRYGLSYKAELAGGGVRLALAVALVALALLPAWLAILTSAAASAVIATVSRPGRARVAPGTVLAEHRRRVLRYLAPTLPSALYFSLQGPLVVWLAATFGSTRNIAEVGALGRLGMIVGLFSGLAGIVYLPRMARITDEGLYRRRFLQYGASLLAVAVALAATAWLVPDVFLLLLGPNYLGLHRELLLVVGAAGLTLLGGYAVGINHARSWNRWQAPALVLLVVVQVALIATLPLSTTFNVLLFNVVTAMVGLLVQLTMTLLGFVRPAWVLWS